ncbi:RHS repeat domain-containing protein [Streptomyces zhihengii]
MAADLPVELRRAAAKSPGPLKAQVQVVGHDIAQQLGVDGLLLAVRPTEGTQGRVEVAVDYSGFRYAYGGDWASRLTLQQLPTCALTTPAARECGHATALKTENDTKSGTLTATVALPDATEAPSGAPVARHSAAASETGVAAAAGTVLLAATAAASGSSGDFKASTLAPSSSWSAGGSNGGFTWKYDIPVPDVPGDVAPKLNLSYSSQSIDGRTAATNNQSNWIGDGWSMEPGYIERRYISCSDDTTNSNTTAKVGDQCWKKDNAVINLNGRSNTLIRDTDSGEWHLESDDGTRIEKAAGGTDRSNGDNNGEYWKVTTPDGTQYYFGYHRLPNWTSGKETTDSTWNMPVYGNQNGEPCHATAFADSWCQQAWRWNLDYVVNPHGDAMAYYWAKEKNHYGRNVNTSTGASTATEYDRGGHLKRIEYGLRHDTPYTQKAAGKVDFTVDERCLANCSTFDKANAKNWPDVPFDQYCAPSTECKDRYSASFWTRKLLKKVTTSVLTGGVYKNVDSIALTHQFPPTGDGTSPALWLASIQRTGHTGTGDVTMPAVVLRGEQLKNRVEGATTGGDTVDPVPPMWRYRIFAIETETGGVIGVSYSAEDCKQGDVPTPAGNNRRCYPVKWSPPDAPAANYEPYLDWFHSYVVTQIRETDNTSNAPDKVTSYSYLDGMAWAKAKDDEFVQAKHLTYGDRKGYGRVQVRTGADETQQLLEEYRYFRGIDGADVADHLGRTVTDREAFAGMTREKITYDGTTARASTSYEPWRSAATATENRAEGLTALHAYATGGKSETTRTSAINGWRETRTDRTFDDVGQLLTESRLGNLAKTGDEECTTHFYAANTAKNMRTLVSEVLTVAVPCGTTPQYPQHMISSERRYYDGATSLSATPVRGDVTRIDEQTAAGTGHMTTATHTYDQHGRELTDTDALGNTSTTAYTPATIEVPTSKTETNTLGHATTTHYEPARGLATAVVDANGKRTDAVHDGLGRTLKVWQPGWSKTGHETKPSVEYLYKVSKTTANVTTTKTLKQNGTYRTDYAFFDGLLRERQTQTAAHATAHSLVTETRYDSRGLLYETYGTYYAQVAPSETLITATSINEVPTATRNLYDRMGRPTAAISLEDNVEKWRTTTTYSGERTTVIPPQGGTATTTVVDAHGRTTELWQYTDAARENADKTTYTYGKYDEPLTVTDPAGNTWTTTFDARGQKTIVDDPDKGSTTTVYDALGRPTTTTDARGITLTAAYDKLGRKTETKQGDTVLAKWTYDTLAKGQLTSSTRYDQGAAYTTATVGYNDRYQPTSTQVTIPGEAGALAGTYTWTYTYDPETGAPALTGMPAVGNVPAENVATNYNSSDLPIRTGGASGALVNNTIYDAFHRPLKLEYGNTLGKKVGSIRNYDKHTGRLIQQTSDRDLAPQRIDDTTITYDPAGNVTGVTTASGQDTARTVDTQCFTTNPLGQLTQAWTTTTACTDDASVSTVGGPDAYWHTYSYDKAGNRTQQIEHGTGILAGSNTTTTYTHPAPEADLPHAVTQTTVQGGVNDGQTSTFSYDEAGNTTQRTTGTRTQDLTWTSEGRLATLTEGAKQTSYLYDADGNRLIAKNPDGSSTLTLPGGNELKATADGTKTGTRYYTHNGETVAVRTGNTISYLLADHQGTAMTAIAAGTLAITRRKQLPFGNLRTEQSDTFATRGFVGGTNDPTGLTHLGAREYDPTLGRFISVDPIIDYNDPAQMNAYSYAHNNPLTKSDPTGLRPDGPSGGNSYNDERWANDRGMTAGYTKKSGKWLWSHEPKKDYSSRQRYYKYRANPSYYKVHQWKSTPGYKIHRGRKENTRGPDVAGAVQRGISGFAKNWMLPLMSITNSGAKKMYDHTYVGASMCNQVCVNFGFQGGTFSLGISGGVTADLPGRSRQLVNRIGAGKFLGASVGYNSAKASEQDFTLASVTAANGPYGGAASWGKTTSGGDFHSFGWAGGRGVAVQGPTLMGLSYTPGNGVTWSIDR